MSAFPSAGPSPHEHQRSASAANKARAQAADDDAALIEFFDRIATALNTGDAAMIASCWEAPALVVSDEGVHAVSSSEETEAFFAGAREQYMSRGITATRAEIVRVSWVGTRTALAEVRWPLLDEKNRELGEERSTYTLRTSDAGELKIRAAIVHLPPSH